MKLVKKNELVNSDVVGPIAEGETPQDAVARLCRTFDKPVAAYAYRMHKRPMVGKNQQFPVIIGTVWIDSVN